MLVALSPVTVSFASNSNDKCSEMEYAQGLCATAGVTGDSVEIGATTEVPGSGGPGVGSGPGDNGANAVGVVNRAKSPVTLICGVGLPKGCKVVGNPPTKPVDDTGPVSISDIATFRPELPTAGMQPNQWMIVGLDTNFYANASTHIVDGTLFGGPAQVRFTPIAYSWDYGDGTSAELSAAGTTWAKQKITEFDATPTSHIYQSAGNYTITLAVTYAAEFRVADNSWQNVVGTLTIIAPPRTATAGHASTVLVDKDCNVNPTGIGC
ncbi:PKD domain-containing protein [Salinibacterium sp. PAMC 21357]|uniref:PKD domain-containing protein n=1 Tax=Salinibacterium sp. PAMC 21357 TaxID=1112215 RepID=UPI000289746E|nr:PKD domain-containing protein [Salinibacterium sp. PAMC 21357]